MFGPEERQRAVGLCSATPMATAQVVEHLGYPTRRCLERCLAKGPRYAGRMRIPIIPPGNRAEGDRTGIGRHAAEASRPAARRGDSPGDDGDVEALRRSLEELEPGETR